MIISQKPDNNIVWKFLYCLKLKYIIDLFNRIIWKYLLQVDRLAADKLHESFVSQAWGIITLGVVLMLAPILVFMAKNAIGSIQVTQM